MEEQYYNCMLPGFEPWGYSSCATGGFLARVDSLQKTGWLPAYEDAGGFAMGLEARIAKLQTVYMNQTLVTGGHCLCSCWPHSCWADQHAPQVDD